MASIQTTIELNDRMSAKLNRITTASNKASAALRGMETASTEAGASSFNGGGLQTSVRNTGTEVDALSNRFNALERRIGAVAGTYLTLQGLQQFVNLTDQATSAQQRMSLITGSASNAVAAQKAIMQSANDSYSDYIDMSNQVAKLMMNAPTTFTNVGETADFVNTFNKLGTLGGASVYESSQAMYQLTQSMAKGKLDGDELRSVMEGMPLVAKTIADSLGVDVGTMKEMAAEGKVTAQVVKDAMNGAMKSVDAQFDAAYGKTKTWSMVWTEFKNNAISAVQPIMDAMNGLWSSDGAEAFGTNVTQALNMVGKAAATVINAISRVGNFISKHWSVFSKIGQGILGILAAHIAQVTTVNAVTGIANGIQSAHASIMNQVAIITGKAAAQSATHAGTTDQESTATQQLQASESSLASARTTNTNAMESEIAGEAALIEQKGQEAAMNETVATTASTVATANETVASTASDAAATSASASATASAGVAGVAEQLGAVFSIITLTITAADILGGIFARAAGTAQTGMGNLAGTVALVGAAFANVGIFIGNLFAWIGKNASTLGTNIVSAFQIAINRTIGFFQNLAATAASVVANIANALNRLPFVNIDTTGLENTASSWAAQASEHNMAADSAAKSIKGFDNAPTFDYKDPVDAYFKYSKKVDKWVTGGTGNLKIDGYKIPNSYSANASTPGASVPGTLNKIKGDTGKIASSTELSQQQLEYLHDIANREAVNKYTTASIVVRMTNNNKINNTNNLEDIVDSLVTQVKGAQLRLAEGV